MKDLGIKNVIIIIIIGTTGILIGFILLASNNEVRTILPSIFTLATVFFTAWIGWTSHRDYIESHKIKIKLESGYNLNKEYFLRIINVSKIPVIIDKIGVELDKKIILDGNEGNFFVLAEYGSRDIEILSNHKRYIPSIFKSYDDNLKNLINIVLPHTLKPFSQILIKFDSIKFLKFTEKLKEQNSRIEKIWVMDHEDTIHYSKF